MVLDHLLHLQLDHRAVEAVRGDVALHEGAVVAKGDPRLRVDGVLHAGDLLAVVVVVPVRDGVHVVAQGVHDALGGGADAHDGAAPAVEAHVEPRGCEGLGLRAHELDGFGGVFAGWVLVYCSEGRAVVVAGAGSTTEEMSGFVGQVLYRDYVYGFGCIYDRRQASFFFAVCWDIVGCKLGSAVVFVGGGATPSWEMCIWWEIFNGNDVYWFGHSDQIETSFLDIS